MEKYMCDKDGKVGSFKTIIKKGTKFTVLRNIMNECVLITDNNEPNIIAEEKELKKFGTLSGTPALGGV